MLAKSFAIPVMAVKSFLVNFEYFMSGMTCKRTHLPIHLNIHKELCHIVSKKSRFFVKFKLYIFVKFNVMHRNERRSRERIYGKGKIRAGQAP